MEAISPAELREHISEILGRVRHGDWIAVVDHGHVAAILCPPPTSVLDGVWRPEQIGTAARPSALPHRPAANPSPSLPPDPGQPDAGQDGPPGRHRR